MWWRGGGGSFGDISYFSALLLLLLGSLVLEKGKFFFRNIPGGLDFSSQFLTGRSLICLH